MAGIYLSDNAILFVQNWANEIIMRKEKWESNNLHIDEIDDLITIKRKDWLLTSLELFNIVRGVRNNSLYLFLHIDLEYSENNVFDNIASLSLIQNNLSEFTPPSFSFTSNKYFNEFYLNQFRKLAISKDLLSKFNCENPPDFYFRTFYDKDEGLFSREIYVF